MYVLTCGDLPIAAQACQAIHAAHIAGTTWPTTDEPHLVFLRATDEADLLRAAEKLSRRGVPFVTWREPDLGGRATALATSPQPAETRWFPRGFPMWSA